ncbi:MAG: hypothetical protein PUC53_03765 [Bacteroidales bacterium]|nr:hypothetical protein [Bacteroidales bacterium]
MREFDNISLEELERIASDESVKVPESLDTEIRASIAILELQEESKVEKARSATRRRFLYGLSAAASIALILGVGLRMMSLNTTPQDTFTDPALAYAELERAFSLMSDKIETGASMAHNANSSIIEQTKQIMTKIQK